MTAVAAVIRLTIFQRFQRGRDFGFNDADYYSEQAIALVDGHWFIDPATGAPGAEHGPLTTLLVAPLSWMDHPQNFQRLATIATGLLCVVVIGLIGHRLGAPTGRSTSTGLVAAGIAAVYPNLWLNDGLVMSESLCTLLVSLWILIALNIGQSLRRVVALGVVGALAVLARSELAVLCIVGALIIWRGHPARRPHSIGVFVASTTLVLAPWVVPNLVRFDNPVVLSTNDGTTLRGANCDRTYSGREIGSWSVFCLVIDPETVTMETSQRSARWRSDALTYAADHASRVPLVVAARLGRTLDLFGLDYQLDEDVRDGRPRLGSILGIGAFWLLAPLAAIGLWRRRGIERLVLWTPIVIVMISTVVFYGGHRIRSPLEPVIVIGAAAAVVEIFSRRRHRDPSQPPPSASGLPGDGPIGGRAPTTPPVAE